LKPIPGRKFRQSLQIARDISFKPFIVSEPIPSPPPNALPEPISKISIATNTTITFAPVETVLEGMGTSSISWSISFFFLFEQIGMKMGKRTRSC
jgi:hypothetical protein